MADWIIRNTRHNVGYTDVTGNKIIEMEDFISNLHNRIKNLDLGYVTSELNTLFTAANSSLETEIIIIEANRRRLIQQEIRNVIPQNEYNIEFNRIINSILELIKEVKDDFSIYFPFISGSQVRSHNLNKDIILFIGANPAKYNIDVRTEVREISEKLRASKKRDFFEFKVNLDVKPEDFQRNIIELDNEPRFFHFAGNALLNDPLYGSGIVLAGENPNDVNVVNGEVLVSILSRFKKIECVFLNACNTTFEAIELSKKIPFVITMNSFVTDSFAIDFASFFYEAIGNGRGIKFSFQHSIDSLKLINKYKEEQIKTPQLLEQGVDYELELSNETIEEWRERVNPV